MGNKGTEVMQKPSDEQIFKAIRDVAASVGYGSKTKVIRLVHLRLLPQGVTLSDVDRVWQNRVEVAGP